MKLKFRFTGKWSLLVVIALLVISCTTPATDSPVAQEPSAQEAPAVSAESTAAGLTAGLPVLNGKATAEIQVDGRAITVELDGEKAPVTAGNFVDLAEKGIYNGTVFHRVVQSPQPFVAQGGDPQSVDPNVPTSRLGTGGYIDPATGQERTIPLEIMPDGSDEIVYGKTFDEAQIQVPPELDHKRGAIAMARSGVNTASAQFYITLADVAFLDGSYAVFGYVTDGMDVVDDIQAGDEISSVRIVSGAENLVLPDDAAPQ
ncbi:peptidyl-prolyl cis-trans isomerase, cyclophilin-type, putative [Synechococcus sp. PCC 7335]|uniref:peptidylprolyl isomerase n=1 Tax=Synechococcus sp. (strain ATCC 29403 / PCC 7335) TaxID=91464 RepID=UPI00017EBBAC|nr:peptidylprolyl isomerase [Synechococcus sp. PCC 7335]EDX87094.1 peptidyl-prolyl cis-trans isomerase, cyclophilin-type, putative [Synechococcus sp. PCC 7335]